MNPILDSIFDATDKTDAMTLGRAPYYCILYLGSGDPVSTLNAFLLPSYLVAKMGRLSLKYEYLTVRLILKTVSFPHFKYQSAGLLNEIVNILSLVERIIDRKSTRLNSSHVVTSRLPSSA